MSPQLTSLVQLVSLILALLALVMGAYLLIIGRRPWRNEEPERVAPRVRLLGLSYILVFGSAMVQIILQPRGLEGEALGGLMVLGGMIVIVVVLLEARASRRAAVDDQSARLDDRLSGR
jgi:threonine/homoserine/homoserine lactone efflux protein